MGKHLNIHSSNFLPFLHNHAVLVIIRFFIFFFVFFFLTLFQACFNNESYILHAYIYMYVIMYDYYAYVNHIDSE